MWLPDQHVYVLRALTAVFRSAVPQGPITVASDSTHFGAYDRNIFTEWHSRYGGRGVLVYWSVEKGSMAIHSQVINCTASEVAAMIEGVMRHNTLMNVEGNYVDSHGHRQRPPRPGPNVTRSVPKRRCHELASARALAKLLI